jgi:HEPN domain-containing protein
MLRDEIKNAETREWLKKAGIDLRAAEHERIADPPITPDIVFHAQQLVEKSLKALLVHHDQPFRKTHNLVELGEQCAKLIPDMEPLLRKAAPLTEYAWKFRYPGEPEEPSIEEADEAMGIAKEVFDTIISKLPSEAYPH